MVEYKVTAKNKKECAEDYVNNHIGEEIKFLNNGKIDCGWIKHTVAKTNEKIWKSNEELFSLYYSVGQIATAMYKMSHMK